jgi:N-acetylglucosaminyl-diphospho-decaprenol L-rhamnosyltransferase
VADLAVIVVSHNSASWLPACLASISERAGGAEIDLMVVDSGSDDATAEVVASHDGARLVSCENRGFAYANNRGFETTAAPWVLFLNPDTQILEGTLSELVTHAERYPGTGIFGVRQVNGDGCLEPSMRRFPHPLRWLGEAAGSEHWPVRGSWLGERVLDENLYERPTQCDWTSGSAMLVRSEVVRLIGGMDESFFLYFEEPDLSLRALRASWRTMHLPALTVVHYGGNQATHPQLAAQLAYSQRLYMSKHFSGPGRIAGIASLALGYLLRAILGPRRSTSRRALATLLRARPAPFPLD